MEKNSLSWQVLVPNRNPIGTILVVHGMSEHKERYEDVAQFFVNHGWAVFLYDHRGHGRQSKEPLGYFGPRGWDQLVEDAETMVQEVKGQYPNLPLILFGHSMGTIVGRCFIQTHDDEIQGLVLSGAPCPRPAVKMGKALAGLICKVKGNQGHSTLLANVTTGPYAKSVDEAKTSFDWLSKNEENVTNYINDDLCGFDFTNQGYYDLCEGLNRMGRVKEYEVHQPHLPIYFIAGQEDPVTGGNKGLLASIQDLSEAGYTEIRQEVYPTLRHEILHEKERNLVYQDILDWIQSHVLQKSDNR